MTSIGRVTVSPSVLKRTIQQRSIELSPLKTKKRCTLWCTHSGTLITGYTWSKVVGIFPWCFARNGVSRELTRCDESWHGLLGLARAQSCAVALHSVLQYYIYIESSLVFFIWWFSLSCVVWWDRTQNPHNMAQRHLYSHGQGKMTVYSVQDSPLMSIVFTRLDLKRRLIL